MAAFTEGAKPSEGKPRVTISKDGTATLVLSGKKIKVEALVGKQKLNFSGRNPSEENLIVQAINGLVQEFLRKIEPPTRAPSGATRSKEEELLSIFEKDVTVKEGAASYTKGGSKVKELKKADKDVVKRQLEIVSAIRSVYRDVHSPHASRRVRRLSSSNSSESGSEYDDSAQVRKLPRNHGERKGSRPIFGAPNTEGLSAGVAGPSNNYSPADFLSSATGRDDEHMSDIHHQKRGSMGLRASRFSSSEAELDDRSMRRENKSVYPEIFYKNPRSAYSGSNKGSLRKGSGSLDSPFESGSPDARPLSFANAGGVVQGKDGRKKRERPTPRQSRAENTGNYVKGLIDSDAGSSESTVHRKDAGKGVDSAAKSKKPSSSTATPGETYTFDTKHFTIEYKQRSDSKKALEITASEDRLREVLDPTEGFKEGKGRAVVVTNEKIEPAVDHDKTESEEYPFKQKYYNTVINLQAQCNTHGFESITIHPNRALSAGGGEKGEPTPGKTPETITRENVGSKSPTMVRPYNGFFEAECPVRLGGESFLIEQNIKADPSRSYSKGDFVWHLIDYFPSSTTAQASLKSLFKAGITISRTCLKHTDSDQSIGEEDVDKEAYDYLINLKKKVNEGRVFRIRAFDGEYVRYSKK